jgi:hypothetical protein
MRRNSEVAIIFGAAAHYRRAPVGSSHDDAHPDSSALHTGKIRSAPLRIGLETTIKYLRRKTSAAAGSGLNSRDLLLVWRRGQQTGATIKYLRRSTSATAGNRLGTTIKYLRRTASAAAGSGLHLKGPITCATPRAAYRRNGQKTALHNERRRGHRAGRHDQVPAQCRELRSRHHDQVPARRCEHRSGHHDQVTATLNKQRRGQRPVHHD